MRGRIPLRWSEASYRSRWATIKWPLLALLIVVVFVVLMPSILFVSLEGDSDSQEIGRSLARLAINFPAYMLSYGIPVVIGSAISLIIYHGIMWKKEFGQFVQPVRDYRVLSSLVPGIFLCVVLTLAVVAFTASETNTSVLGRLANNPGGWFTLSTGILSVIGVYLTLSNVLDVRNSIVSFADFVDRITKLIDETGGRDCIYMMLHTPAPGCLVLPPEIWEKLADELKTCKRSISLTCLSQSQMLIWFQEYTRNLGDAKLKSMQDRIENGLAQSELIKKNIKLVAKKYPEKPDAGVLEATWSDLPLCYYVANSRRAIVVAPFFLPRPGEGSTDPVNVHNRSIQMIGFETTDFHIVDTVRREIESRRSSINRQGSGSDSAGQRGIVPDQLACTSKTFPREGC